MSGQNVQNAGNQGEAAPAPSPDEGFDAAVAEFLKEPSDPAHGAAADGNLGDTAGSAADTPAPSQDAATPLAAGDGSPPAGSSPDDIWKDADPRLREAHENAIRDANLRLEGIKGRQSAADREAQKLRQRVAELESAQTGAGHQTETQGDAGARASSDRLKELREEFPDIAGPLVDEHEANRSEIEALRAQVSRLEQPITSLQQDQQAAYYAAQEAKLREAHSDYREVVNGDVDRYNGWLSRQPAVIQEIAARNAEHVVDGAEIALVVGLFKSDLGLQGPSAPDPAQAIEQRRERQRAASRDTGRNGPSVTTGIPDDFDAAVAHFLRT